MKEFNSYNVLLIVFSKYPTVVPSKDKKKTLQLLDEFLHKPNKIWIDKGGIQKVCLSSREEGVP